MRKDAAILTRKDNALVRASKVAIRAANQLCAFWKWCLSFRKSTWELDDYPVVYRRQNPIPFESGSRFQSHLYIASIVNWTAMDATGDTRLDARVELLLRFENEKIKEVKTVKRLPRPGTRVPLKFASLMRVNAHTEFADDFVKRILGLEWCVLTDESSLWHFHFGESNDELFARIKEIYGVDVSYIESGNIAEILERIAAARRTA